MHMTVSLFLFDLLAFLRVDATGILLIGGLILFFILLTIFVVVMIVISSRKRADRAAKLQVIAQQLGFSFTPKPPLPDFLRNTRFAQWYPAVGTGMSNLLAGNMNGRSVLIFDYGYMTSFGGAATGTYFETVLCIPRNTGDPFYYYRERVLVPPEQYRAFLDTALQAFNHG